VSRAIAPARSCGDATGNFMRYGSRGGCGPEFHKVTAPVIRQTIKRGHGNM